MIINKDLMQQFQGATTTSMAILQLAWAVTNQRSVVDLTQQGEKIKLPSDC